MTSPSTDADHNGRIDTNDRDAGAESSREEQPAPSRGLQKSRTIRLIALVAVLVMIAAVAGMAYFLHADRYVTTDNAQIDGHQIQINAPATGTLTDWNLTEGSTVRENQLIARVRLTGSGAEPKQTVRSPDDGTIAVTNAVNGQWVTTGTNLATAYNTADGIYATARVDETDVRDVYIGAPVDISVDAASDTPVTGIVVEIQNSAAAVFSLFPQSNSSGNFQKVSQVIPVKIDLLNTGGVALAPGMNITVRIHKKHYTAPQPSR